jgi:mono/diheme cytochrome c family protein
MQRNRILRAATLILCVASFAAQASEASDLYDKKCSVCHGDDGQGQTKMGKRFHSPDFTSAKWQAGEKDAELKRVIEEGVVKDGVHRMPSWKGKLTATQIDALVRLVRGFAKR